MRARFAKQPNHWLIVVRGARQSKLIIACRRNLVTPLIAGVAGAGRAIVVPGLEFSGLTISLTGLLCHDSLIFRVRRWLDRNKRRRGQTDRTRPIY